MVLTRSSVIWFFVVDLALSLPTQIPKINTSFESHCNFNDNKLFCDFKDSELETVYLEPLNKTHEKIYVHNLPKLQLSQSFCTNLALKNIRDVVILEDDRDPCTEEFTLAAKNTSLERLPYRVNDIYLENSNMSSLVTHSVLSKLTVINSYIGVLNISTALTEESSVIFTRSNIGTLQKLNLDKGKLVMEDTNISMIPPKGLIVISGIVSIKDSFFHSMSNDSIIIYPSATLDLENFSGHLKISDMLITTKHQVYLGAEEKNNNTFSPVVICLSLLTAILIACLIALSVYSLKNKKNKDKSSDSDKLTIKGPSDVNEIENANTEYTNEEVKKLLPDQIQISPIESSSSRGDVREEKQRNTTQTNANIISGYNQKKQETHGALSKKSQSYSLRDKDKKESLNFLKPGEEDITLSNVQRVKHGHDMAPEPQDMITDNIVIFRKSSTNHQQISDVPNAILTGKLKVGLKKTIYKWNQVYDDICSRKTSLSNFPEIELSGFYFDSIRNGDHLSKMNKRIVKIVEESKIDGSYLSPGQESIKENLNPTKEARVNDGSAVQETKPTSTRDKGFDEGDLGSAGTKGRVALIKNLIEEVPSHSGSETKKIMPSEPHENKANFNCLLDATAGRYDHQYVNRTKNPTIEDSSMTDCNPPDFPNSSNDFPKSPEDGLPTRGTSEEGRLALQISDTGNDDEDIDRQFEQLLG